MRSASATVDRRCATTSVVRPRQPPERLDQLLILGVDAARWLVQEENRRVFQEGSGDGQTLAFATRQAQARSPTMVS